MKDDNAVNRILGLLDTNLALGISEGGTNGTEKFSVTVPTRVTEGKPLIEPLLKSAN